MSFTIDKEMAEMMSVKPLSEKELEKAKKELKEEKEKINKKKAYLVAMSLMEKAGARHSFRDVSLLQQIHDMVCELGASCFLNEEDDSNLVEQSERDYKKEYREYHSKPKQKKNRAKRNAARRMMIKEGRARKGDGKEVDHKDGNPNNNSSSNLRVVSKKTNREKG